MSNLLQYVERSDRPGYYRLSDADLLRLVLREENDYVPRRELAIALQDALNEVERLREALERVYQTGRGPHVKIAREALNA